MSKQQVPPRKKYALWLAHKSVCQYCKEPLNYKDVCVDHILPEHLLKTPDKLKHILHEYELDLDFDLEDYCNLIPTHWRCNLDKGSDIFNKNAARYYINIANKKAAAAKKKEQKSIRNLKKDKLLWSLEIALSEGLLSKKDILLTLLVKEPKMGFKEEPKIITFGLNYYDLWKSNSRPDWLSNYEPSDYPFVCDLLEKDLVKQLKSLLSCELFYSEASGRNGESLSVRLAFVRLAVKEIIRVKIDLWEILEYKNYSQVYGEAFCENSLR